MSRHRSPRMITWLVALVVLPTVGMALLAGSAAWNSWSERQASAEIAGDALTANLLVASMAIVSSEAAPSVTVAAAAAQGVNVATLQQLLGIDFTAEMRQARTAVDADPVLRDTPTLAVLLPTLVSLRAQVDAGTPSFNGWTAWMKELVGGYSKLWQREVAAIERLNPGGTMGADTVGGRLDVMQSAFNLLETANDRGTLTGLILTGGYTPQTVQSLIAVNTRSALASAALGTGLGPKASAAWRVLEQDVAARRYDAMVNEAISVGLAGSASPLVSSPSSYVYAQWVTDGARSGSDVVAVVQAAAIDLGDLARAQSARASHELVLQIGAAVLVTALVVVATTLLAQAVVRPVRRLSDAAREIGEGRFSMPALPVAGPRELAQTSQAVNDMTNVLGALERHTMTLADDPESALLDEPLPGRVGHALQVASDRLRGAIRDKVRDAALLQETATHDGLTGLLNRGAALDAVSRDLSRARRDGTQMALLFIDLDDLKGLNDRFGHDVGDDAIRQTAAALCATTRQSEVVARLGGDEFLLEALGVSGPEEAEALAGRVLQALADRALCVDGKTLTISCSIGVTMARPDDTVELVIHRADQALLVAKRSGRGRFAWSAAPDVAVPT